MNTSIINKKAKKIMTAKPQYISSEALVVEALNFMNKKKITSLLVTSEKGLKSKTKNLRGIVHIHSILQFGIK